MKHLLAEAGKSFLRAFGGSLLILLPGVLAAPDLGQTLGLAAAASIASVIAGLKVLQVFVPQLAFSHYLSPAYAGYAAILDSGVRALVGAFLALLPGILSAPDLNAAKALFVAGLIAAVTAGIRAIQGILTPGETPLPEAGIKTP